MTIDMDEWAVRRPRLVMPVGLPGCGKTTAARAWVAVDPQRRVRVSRDDLREMFHGDRLGTDMQESQVSRVAHASVRLLLRDGVDVVMDATHLVEEHRAALRALAAGCGCEVVVWDFTGVPVQECIARDAARGAAGGRHVGAHVIRALHAQHLPGPGA